MASEECNTINNYRTLAGKLESIHEFLFLPLIGVLIPQ